MVSLKQNSLWPLADTYHLDAADMDIYGALQFCSIGILAVPLTVKKSETYFHEKGRNTVFVWTSLLLAGLVSLAVEFYRSNSIPCYQDNNGNPISSDPRKFPYGDSPLCGITCSQTDGPFSRLRQKAASEIFVVPRPNELRFGNAMFLAVACCVPAIISLISMRNKIVITDWIKKQNGPQKEKGNESEESKDLHRTFSGFLNLIEIFVFGGAALAILILGEINLWSPQMDYHTEPFGSVAHTENMNHRSQSPQDTIQEAKADPRRHDQYHPYHRNHHYRLRHRAELGQETTQSLFIHDRHRGGDQARLLLRLGRLKAHELDAGRLSKFLVNVSSRLPRAWRQYSSVPSNKLPLEGYRVLDMTRVLAGPYCTQILGDLGAEVIKVEHPVRGDDTRAWGPPYATYKAGSSKEGPGESAYFLAVNRNKKSLGLNFQHPSGTEILHKLVSQCDILVENYLPGTLKKYKMDYDTLRAINPGLIYASITGYGQTGPYSDRAGYDVMVEAEFGLMHITGSRDGEPVKVGVAVTDLTTGLYTSNSIMAALLARGRTGRGQHIDVALSDCQTATLANIASSCLISGKKDSGRWGTAHPSIVPYKSFKTKDGDILFGGGNDRLYGILCQGLNKPEWQHDAKYATNANRVANRVELEGLIEQVTVTKTTAEWLRVFEGKGMPYAAVNDVQGTLEHEHTKARNMVVEMEHEECGPIRMVNTPVKYSESEPSVRSVPPTLGQHTDEVLGGHLGFSEERIRALKGEGVVG
ncbi:uncharacterized protein N0V96_002724 [Colletotrichum fioriniae]|uniref:uncharacterized protein n=1 Tax=Colletotrichum fioriniae TaxID=710243 RepID=UPI0032DB5187|nr:hypothetical protein N0V96_002724 [Colletotrichum fioriniae]